MINAKQSKLIHLAKRRIDMSNPDYRAMLQRVAGVTSSRDLDAEKFSAVMEEFGRLGFQTVQTAPQFGEREGMASPAQINYLRSLFRQYAGSEDDRRLERFLEKHFKVSSLRFLDSTTVPKVVATFRRMAEYRKTHPQHKAANRKGPSA